MDSKFIYNLIGVKYKGEDITVDSKTSYFCSPKTNSSGFTLLMKLCMMTNRDPGILNVIDELLKSNPECIDIKNTENWSALHLAARNCCTYSSIETIKLLLDHGADINCITDKGLTPVMFAGYSGNIEAVKLFIDYGANLHLQTVRGSNILSLLSRLDKLNIDIIKLLVDNGCNINTPNIDGLTPLCYIVREPPNLDIVKKYIEYGADVNIVLDNNITPLYCSLKNTHDSSAAEILIEYGADICINNNTYNECIRYPNVIKKYIYVLKRQIQTERKLFYNCILSGIPVHKNAFIFAPNHIGQIITLSKYSNIDPEQLFNNIKTNHPYILHLLNINSKDDIRQKFDEYIKVHC